MVFAPLGDGDWKGLLRWGGLRAAVAMDTDGPGDLGAINWSMSCRAAMNACSWGIWGAQETVGHELVS